MVGAGGFWEAAFCVEGLCTGADPCAGDRWDAGFCAEACRGDDAWAEAFCGDAFWAAGCRADDVRGEDPGAVPARGDPWTVFWDDAPSAADAWEAADVGAWEAAAGTVRGVDAREPTAAARAAAEEADGFAAPADEDAWDARWVDAVEGTRGARAA